MGAIGSRWADFIVFSEYYCYLCRRFTYGTTFFSLNTMVADGCDDMERSSPTEAFHRDEQRWHPTDHYAVRR